jgi:TctA family transporter
MKINLRVIIYLALLCIPLILLATLFRDVSFRFGSAEYLLLIVLILLFSAALFTRSFYRGIASAMTGSLLSLVNSPDPMAPTRFNSVPSYGFDDLSLVVFPACVVGALISVCLHFNGRPLRKNNAFLSFRWLPVMLVFVTAFLCFYLGGFKYEVQQR